MDIGDLKGGRVTFFGLKCLIYQILQLNGGLI